jgi:signal peptide peptidase SppA
MYEQILTAANDAVWLCHRPKLDAIFGFLDTKAAGLQVDSAAVQMAALDNRQRRASRTETVIGVIPVYGTISQRVGMLEEASGGVSTETLSREFDMMMAEDSISSIVMEYDSFGGTYPGIPELASKIYQARADKRIVSQINANAGSGALWLASAATEVVITPSGEAGSIGAYLRLVNEAGLNEQLGIQPEYISYGEFKTEGNPDEPLTDESRAFLQERINRIGKEFETAIAKYRGVSVSKVQKEFGRGRMLDAKTAAEVGLVDRIGTFAQTIQRIAKPAPRSNSGKNVESLRRRLEL